MEPKFTQTLVQPTLYLLLSKISRWPLYIKIQKSTPWISQCFQLPRRISCTNQPNCNLIQDFQRTTPCKIFKFIRDRFIHQGSKQESTQDCPEWQYIKMYTYIQINLHLLAKHQSIQNPGNVYQIIKNMSLKNDINVYY